MNGRIDSTNWKKTETAEYPLSESGPDTEVKILWKSSISEAAISRLRDWLRKLYSLSPEKLKN